MRLVLTADLHGSLPTIPDCDILVIAGDVCPDFLRQYMRSGDIRVHRGIDQQVKWLVDTFVPWLNEVPAAEKVVIAGNHDFALELPSQIPDVFENACHYLMDEGAIVSGINFWGTPWCPNLPFWAFYGDDGRLERQYAKVPEDTEIFVTHSPPYAHGDKVRMGEHVGSIHCLRAVRRVRPKLTVTGHIHEAYGWYQVDDEEGQHLQVYNVAHNTVRYEPINAPVVVDL